ncbi:hypothetical protein, partial [Pengzhenrongella frigida]
MTDDENAPGADRAADAAADTAPAVAGGTADGAGSRVRGDVAGVPSLAERVAVLRAQVDALTRVAPRDLDGDQALALFDDLFDLGDRLTALAVQMLPTIDT